MTNARLSLPWCSAESTMPVMPLYQWRFLGGRHVGKAPTDTTGARRKGSRSVGMHCCTCRPGHHSDPTATAPKNPLSFSPPHVAFLALFHWLVPGGHRWFTAPFTPLRCVPQAIELMVDRCHRNTAIWLAVHRKQRDRS